MPEIIVKKPFKHQDIGSHDVVEYKPDPDKHAIGVSERCAEVAVGEGWAYLARKPSKRAKKKKAPEKVSAGNAESGGDAAPGGSPTGGDELSPSSGLAQA